MIIRYISEWETVTSVYYMMIDDLVVICSVEVEVGKDYNRIHSFYTQENYRGMGYGTDIMDILIIDFSDCELCLSVHDNNSKAISLYKKFGFVYCENCKNIEGEKWMMRPKNK